jgi:glycerophosphoryl diester phosphodiesterase
MLLPAFVAIVATASLPSHAAFASGHGHEQEPRLMGRAVLPADTLAPGPPSGALIPSANGITFPRPSQPVEGFSAIVDGRTAANTWPCRTTAMAESHVGDFLIRATTSPRLQDGSRRNGSVDVGDFISSVIPTT